MYVCMYRVRPTNRPYVHLGLRVPNLCRILKWLNTKMATTTYGSNYLLQTASNEQVFEEYTVEAPNFDGGDCVGICVGGACERAVWGSCGGRAVGGCMGETVCGELCGGSM